MQYNNEIENLDETDVLAEEVVFEEETEKKESFFKKHAYFMGVLTSIICFAIVLAGLKGMLKITGQLLIIGEAGASTISGDSVLSDAAVEKIDEIFTYMNIYYYGEIDKEEIYNSMYSGVLES